MVLSANFSVVDKLAGAVVRHLIEVAADKNRNFARMISEKRLYLVHQMNRLNQLHILELWIPMQVRIDNEHLLASFDALE